MWNTFIHRMSTETLFFIVIILLFNAYFHLRFTRENAQKAPAFLTTLGILGTFVGIAIGLSHFDANDVQRSVPALISGIKTAVWASALGIFCALSIKFREIWALRKAPPARPQGATADDIADLLTKLDGSVGRVEQAVRGQDERSEERLVAALAKIVQDFNGKISDQFGENFKKLNEACGAINTILSNSTAFSKTAADLSMMMTTLNSQRVQIETSLASLAAVLDKASDGLPKLAQMTEQLAHANTQFNAHMGAMVAKTKEQVATLDAALSEELTKSLNSFGRQMAALSQKFAADYAPITERLQAVLAIGK